MVPYQADPSVPVRPVSLAALFVRKLVMAYVLLGMLIFGIQLLAEYRSHRAHLRDGLQVLASTFAPGAAAAMWDFQETSLESMVEGMGRQRDVVAVEIMGNRGDQRFSWRAKDGSVVSNALTIVQPLEMMDRAGIKRVIGSLTISSSEGRLWQRLREAFGSILLVGGALMLAVGFVVWALVHTLVVRPLTQFSNQVAALGGASARESIDLGHIGVSEIATLQNGFNRLMHEIGENQGRIADQNANLEQKVAERTRDLEAANQAKSEFLARMSHEIRTPMNAVIGLTQLVLRTELQATQRDFLQKVLGAAQALLAIINDILDFSKIEAGKLTLEIIDFDIQRVLDSLRNTLGHKAEEQHIGLVLRLAPAVPRQLVGDPTRLGQILLNLASNAIKFTQHGHVTVSADVKERQGSQVRLQFCVEDSGIGLTEAQIGTLFQSFHQTDGSITRRFGGTGLGLAITKQLVDMMEGRVWVESEPGRGSRFFFEVALGVSEAKANVVNRRRQELPDSPARRNVDAIRGARVLLVEDNPINQLVATNFLEIDGMRVDVAHNGAEGVEKALTGDYVLVLMDIQMPVMGGLEAARKIRATPGFESLPIVAMTANALVTDYQNSIDAGMNEHITKPIDQLQLTDVLLRFIAPLAQPLPASSAVAQVPRLQSPTAHEVVAKPTTAKPPVADVALPVTQHLDTARGLMHVGGSAQIYRTLLKNFLSSHAHDAQGIAESLAQGNTDVARRMAHTLKGTGATVGAAWLSAQALTLETAIKAQNAAALPDALETVRLALRDLCADLETYFQPQTVSASAAAASDTLLPVPQTGADLVHDRGQLCHGLELLAVLLEAANLDSIQLAATMASQCSGTPWADAVQAIQQDVDRMEFALAQAKVQALLRQEAGGGLSKLKA